MSLTTTASSRLASELLARSLDGAVAVLGGEANERLVLAAPCREAREHVGGRLEHELEPLVLALLDLVLAPLRRREVGHGRRHQQHVAARKLLIAGSLQLGRGADLAAGHAIGLRERHVGGNQRDLCSARAGGAREGEAHAS